MLSFAKWLLVPALVLVWACNDNGVPPQTGASAPSGSASAPKFKRGEDAAPKATAAASQSSKAAASAEPSTSKSAAAAEPSGTSSAAAPPAALPEVSVKNIGMHIGGGPNDSATKRPIRNAVKAQYDAMRACYAKAVEPGKSETFGVDIRIGRKGGQAKISHPRSGLKGDGVTDCMVKAFEAAEFPVPPKRAPTVVSFSVRFTKK